MHRKTEENDPRPYGLGSFYGWSGGIRTITFVSKEGLEYSCNETRLIRFSRENIQADFTDMQKVG
jgi:hypothetical protein